MMTRQLMCIFFSVILNTDARPFSNLHSLHNPGSAFYPPTQRFLETFPGRLTSSIRQPALQPSEMINRMKKKFDGLLPSRSAPMPGILSDQYPSDIRQETVQKLSEFGVPAKDTVQNSEKLHGHKMQHVKEMLHQKFRPDDMKERLKQTIFRKKVFTNKLYGMAWREKYVGIPYHTMNDDHMIVKKPGVNFDSPLPPQPNIGIPIPVSVPAIQLIVTQHPVLPEVTTSVNLYQESETSATKSGYVFPISLIHTFTPEVTETLDISNSISQDGLTTSSNSIETIISIDPATGGSNSGENNTGTRFTQENDITEELETVFASLDLLSENKDENFAEESIDQDAITEIGSNLSSLFLLEEISQIEMNEPVVSQTTMLIDLFYRIEDNSEPFTSSIVDVQSTTIEIDPTYQKEGDEFISSMNNTETTIAATAIAPLFSPTFLIDDKTILRTAETTLQPPQIETTTLTDEISNIMGTGFTSAAFDLESTRVSGFTFLPITPTDRPAMTDVISTTVYAPFDGSSTIDRKMTTESISTLPSAIPAQTSPWSSLTSGTSSILEEVSGFRYNLFQSLTDEVETTTGFDLTFPSTIQTETTTMLTQESETVDPIFDNSTILEQEKSTEASSETISPKISTFPSETTIDQILTTSDPTYHEAEETLIETFSPMPSTVSPQATLWPFLASETTPLMNVLTKFGYNHFPTSRDDSETTAAVGSTVSSQIPSETTTIITETSKTVDTAFDGSIIAVQTTTEILSVSSTTISPPNLKITSAIADPPSFDTFTTYDEITSDDSTIFYPGIATEPTVISASEIDELRGLTIVEDTTTDAELPGRIPNLKSPMVIGELITDYSEVGGSTNNMGTKMENIAAFSSAFEIRESTIQNEIFGAVDESPSIKSTSDETILEDILTFPNTIFPEITSRFPLPSEIYPLANILSRFEYNRSPSLTDGIEMTTEFDSVIPLTDQSEETAMLTEELIAFDPTFDDLTIGVKSTTEILPTIPPTIFTETMTTSKEMSTNKLSEGWSIADDTTITYPTETTEAPTSEITALLDVVPNLTHSYVTDSTLSSIITTGADFLITSATPSEESTTMTEKLISSNPASDESSIGVKSTTEIYPTIPSTIFTKTTTTLERISATTVSNSSLIADDTTIAEMIQTIPSIFLTETTTVPVPELATRPDVVPDVRRNYVADSIFSQTETTEVDWPLSSTILPQTTARTSKKSTISTLQNSLVDIDIIAKDVDYIFSSIISTETTTNPEDISQATYSALSNSTDDSETTTEIVWTFPGTISIETSTTPTHEYGSIAEQKFEYRREIQGNSDNRVGRLLHTDSYPILPARAHGAEEELLDEITLLKVIPSIIEELRQDNVNPEEERTLSRIFGDMWSLLKEESKRRQGEPMNHKLAIFLFEAGQRISVAGNLVSKPKRYNSINSLTNLVMNNSLFDISKRESAMSDAVSNLPRNTAELLAVIPENGVRVGFEEADDEEYKA